MPGRITTGPDGALWFTEFAGNKLARITPAGAVAEYALLPPKKDATGVITSGPTNIAAGPDGNLWFIEGLPANYVSRMSLSGIVTRTAGASFTPVGITAGPDSRMWVTVPQDDMIEAIDSAGNVTGYPLPGHGLRSADKVFPYGIAAGPDGSLWFTTNSSRVIGSITRDGVVTQYQVPVSPVFPIVTGPDGNLWFTALTMVAGSSSPVVGKITTAGKVTVYTVPGTTSSFGLGLAVGPDGNLWFTSKSAVGRISPAGDVTVFAVSAAGGFSDITTGPDGNLWLVDTDNNNIGRFTPPLAPQDFLPVVFFDLSPSP